MAIYAVLSVACAPGIAGPAPESAPHLWVPKNHLTPQDVAVVVNDRDPLSTRIGRYYQKRRAIPSANIIHVDFRADRDVMPAAEFNRIDERVARLTPPGVQAYALTWRRPYRVACMSITAAFAMGFDKSDCASGCKPTKLSPYFDSNSVSPFDDYGIRPAMSIAAKDFADAKALIDRGRGVRRHPARGGPATWSRPATSAAMSGPPITMPSWRPCAAMSR